MDSTTKTHSGIAITPEWLARKTVTITDWRRATAEYILGRYSTTKTLEEENMQTDQPKRVTLSWEIYLPMPGNPQPLCLCRCDSAEALAAVVLTLARSDVYGILTFEIRQVANVL